MPLSISLPYLLRTFSAISSRANCCRRSDLDEPLKDRAHQLGIGLVDDQLAIPDLVTQRRPAAHPHAPLAGGRELVADALANYLALELGKGQQHIQGQPAHRGGGIEGLRHGDEGDPVLVEHLDQPGKIHQRAGQPVDLVDHDDIDLAGLDVGQQPLERGALQGATGEAAIVIAVGDEDPSLGALAGDIGLAGLPLGIEGVELHLETLLARLAGIDRASEFLARRRGRGRVILHAVTAAVLQPEEHPAIPAYLGDLARYGRQRLVGSALDIRSRRRER